MALVPAPALNFTPVVAELKSIRAFCSLFAIVPLLSGLPFPKINPRSLACMQGNSTSVLTYVLQSRTHVLLHCVTDGNDNRL